MVLFIYLFILLLYKMPLDTEGALQIWTCYFFQEHVIESGCGVENEKWEREDVLKTDTHLMIFYILINKNVL